MRKRHLKFQGILALGMACLATAMVVNASAQQITDVTEQTAMTSAIQWLSSQEIINLNLSGSKVTGLSTLQYSYSGTFKYTINQVGDPVIMLNLERFEKRSGQTTWTETTRWVGDGSTLWQYNVQAATYMSFSYLVNGKADIKKFQTDFSSIADAYASEIALLINQAYVSGNPFFNNWIGGSLLSLSSTFNSFIFTNSDTKITYNVDTSVPGETHFTSVNSSRADLIAGLNIYDAWTLSVTPIQFNNPLVFQFVLPQGATPISIGR